MASVTVDSSKFPSLKGRIALVTGGSAGIGLCLVKSLAALDCQVAIGDISPPPISSLPISKSVVFQKTDVSNYASLLSLFKLCKSKFGSYPDIVFANAGIGEKGQVFGNDKDDIAIEPKHEVLDIDLKAVANTVRIAWWGCKQEKKEGSIILTASMAGYVGQPGLDMYNAAKHGVVGLMRALRYSAPKDRLAISLLAPGITATNIIASPALSVSDTVSALKSAGVPLNTPERIAEAGIYLVSLGRQANGMGLAVQGGKVSDFEKGLAKSRPHWMGQEMSIMYKGGKKTDDKQDDFFEGLKKRTSNL